MTALVFGWIGTILLLSFNIPQIWRTCVRGLTAGLPASRAWLAIAVATVWLGYGLAGGGLVQVVLNGTTIALNLALLIGLHATRQRRGLLLVLLAVASTGTLFVTGGKEAVGVVGAVVGCGVYLPQVMALRRTGSFEGVSALALKLQIAGAACWFMYGLLRSEIVVMVPNVLVLLTTAWALGLLVSATGPRIVRAGGKSPVLEAG